jgi:hypothetical protein
LHGALGAASGAGGGGGEHSPEAVAYQQRLNLRFSGYLQSAEYRNGRCWRLDPQTHSELCHSAIRSLNGLLRWCRERHPSAYRNYSYWNEMTGRQATIELWKDYERWFFRQTGRPFANPKKKPPAARRGSLPPRRRKPASWRVIDGEGR